MAIDFTLTEAQQQLRRDAGQFAESVLRPVAAQIDRTTDAWEAFLSCREPYRAMARAGFTKSFIPAEFGGGGASMVDLAIAAEELSTVDVNVPGALIGTALGLQPIIQFGTPEQKERFLRPFTDDSEGDSLASFAFTELAGGANYDSPDPNAGIQTVARRDGDEWVLTGAKHYATNGTGWNKRGCSLYTVVCRLDLTSAPDESLAVIAVPGDSAGIRIIDVYDKVGNRGVVTPSLRFDEVRVPVGNLVGEPGRGAKRVIAGAFGWSAALLGSACVGLMRAAFEYALDFAKTEKRLGSVPVIEHQSVGFMLADIKMKLEACRYLTWKACHDFELTEGRAQELAVAAKVYCSEAAVNVVYDCLRIVGVASYTTDLAPLERLMRDAMGFPLFDGGNLGVRRRQLHDMLRQPGYTSMLAANGEAPPWL